MARPARAHITVRAELVEAQAERTTAVCPLRLPARQALRTGFDKLRANGLVPADESGTSPTREVPTKDQT